MISNEDGKAATGGKAAVPVPAKGVSLESFAVDAQAVEEGVWVKVPALGEAAEVHTRGLNCRAYRRMQAKQQRKLIQQIARGGQIDPIQQDIYTARCFVETLILPDASGEAWRGLLDGNGQPIPYDKKALFSWLTEPKWKIVADAFAAAAGSVGEKIEEFEADLGEGS